MKRLWASLFVLGLFIGFSGAAHASLTVVGTASYQGNTYNLIYDNNGPYGPITWLDYTKDSAIWQNRVNWATALGSGLTVTLNPGYTSTINWTTGWGLPTTVDDGTNMIGYNMTSSEMGHLFNTELGGSLTNAYGFNNLHPWQYFSGTPYYNPYFNNPDDWAWYFHFGQDYQGPYSKSSAAYALAVREGDVSAVPIPAGVWLLGSGFVGLGVIRRQFTK